MIQLKVALFIRNRNLRSQIAMILEGISPFDDVFPVQTIDGIFRNVSENHHLLVITDLKMEYDSMADMVKKIRRTVPSSEIIILTAVSNEFQTFLESALSAGILDVSQLSETMDISTQLRRILRPLISLVKIRFGTVPEKAALLRENYKRNRTGSFDRKTVPLRIVDQSLLPSKSEYAVVAIGVSTGGPGALGVVIPALPKNIGVPVIIVQHMPSGFTNQMAINLDAKSKLTVREAKNGEEAVPDTVYIAPGGIHLKALFIGNRMILRTQMSAPVNSCRPSVDVLLNSLEKMPNGKAIVVIMTGMGEDGAKGASKLRSMDLAWNIAQDEESSVVFGMPGALVKSNAADEVVSLDNLAVAIKKRLGITK
ncbi:MAG: hypothetical protein JXR95_02125 [Deltaproteobacteria bacterium]|nr:hypothetical protein [Deltaproteobacteria bacterium]